MIISGGFLSENRALHMQTSFPAKTAPRYLVCWFIQLSPDSTQKVSTSKVCASYNKDRMPHSSLEPAVRIPGENSPTFFKKTLLIKTPRGADGRYMLATRPGGVYNE